MTRLVLGTLVISMFGCGESTAPLDGALDGASEDAFVGDDAGVDAFVGEDASTDEDAFTEEDAGVDSGPMDEPCDAPGALETVSCGLCGSRDRFCTAEMIWSYGPCAGERPMGCVPGTTSMVACGACGMQQARCTTMCTLEPFGACSGEGECAPGTRTRTNDGCAAMETREVLCDDMCAFEDAGACSFDPCSTPGAMERVECGSCGEQDRVCGDDGTWAYGVCEDEGMCEPGTLGDAPCGMCGTQRARCNVACEWAPVAICMGEGECAAGTTRRTTEGCPEGESQVQRCSETCGCETEVACAAVIPVDVTLLFDMTGSHAGDVESGATAIADDIVAELLAIEGVQVGISYYADFGGTDVPFTGGIAPTDDEAALRAELAGAPRYGGGDLPESGIEALDVLTGGAPHPQTEPLRCAADRVAGGCWRPSAQRIVVAFTDAPNHNGPQPIGLGLYVPYTTVSPPPAEWPDVLTNLNRDGVTFFAVVKTTAGADAESQHRRMLSDLRQPASQLIRRSGAGWAAVGTALTDAL